MELTPYNIDLIRLKARATDAREVYVPTINEPNVSWLAYRSACKIRYYDAASEKWYSKTMAVKGETDEAIQTQCDKVSRVLQ
eukprot:1395115-Pyramimonas_sp.AAC.1